MSKNKNRSKKLKVGQKLRKKLTFLKEKILKKTNKNNKLIISFNKKIILKKLSHRKLKDKIEQQSYYRDFILCAQLDTTNISIKK